MKKRPASEPLKSTDQLRLCKKCKKNSTFMPDDICSTCRNDDDDAENDKPDERR